MPDETSNHITCEPDAPVDAWQSTVRERVSQIQQSISDWDGTKDVTTARRDDILTYGSERFVSVFVNDPDELDSVVEMIITISFGDYSGIVLRSPGNYANRVQRFADRLCDQSTHSETPLSSSFRKEYSDDIGDDKNGLEFRLFLRRT